MEDSLLLQIFFFPHLSRQCRLGQKNQKYSPPHPIHLTISSSPAHAIHTSPSVEIDQPVGTDHPEQEKI
jgi:hypothetical protein